MQQAQNQIRKKEKAWHWWWNEIWNLNFKEHKFETQNIIFELRTQKVQLWEEIKIIALQNDTRLFNLEKRKTDTEKLNSSGTSTYNKTEQLTKILEKKRKFMPWSYTWIRFLIKTVCGLVLFSSRFDDFVKQRNRRIEREKERDLLISTKRKKKRRSV